MISTFDNCSSKTPILFFIPEKISWWPVIKANTSISREKDIFFLHYHHPWILSPRLGENAGIYLINPSKRYTISYFSISVFSALCIYIIICMRFFFVLFFLSCRFLQLQGYINPMLGKCRRWILINFCFLW